MSTYIAMEKHEFNEAISFSFVLNSIEYNINTIKWYNINLITNKVFNCQAIKKILWSILPGVEPGIF